MIYTHQVFHQCQKEEQVKKIKREEAKEVEVKEEEILIEAQGWIQMIKRDVYQF